MSRLVVCRKLFSSVGHYTALLLGPHLLFSDGLFYFFITYEALFVGNGHQSRLVEQILEIGAGKSGSAAGN